jgi:hypothetical protein
VVPVASKLGPVYGEDFCRARASTPCARLALAPGALYKRNVRPLAPSRLQERFESTPAGRVAISLFIVVTLAFVVVTNLPRSSLRHDVLVPGQPYLNALGLDQRWNVFAPEPRKQAIDLVSLVTFSDGSQTEWRLPSRAALVGAYSDYRWRKWLENATADAHRELWRPQALWIARNASSAGRRPVRVVLVRRFYDLLPPGTTPDRGPWKEFAYYTLDLPAGGGGG